MRYVHGYSSATCVHDELVDTGHGRNVQRDELVVRERKLASPAALEEQVPCGSYYLEYGPALRHSLRSLLRRE